MRRGYDEPEGCAECLAEGVLWGHLFQVFVLAGVAADLSSILPVDCSFEEPLACGYHDIVKAFPLTSPVCLENIKVQLKVSS